MSDKIANMVFPARRNAVLYSIGRAALLLMALLTLADLVRVYTYFGTEIAVGMIIPRMGAMLGYTGSGVPAVLCNIVAYLVFAAAIICAVFAGRKFAWSVVALAIFSADTLAALWLFLASPSLGFVPSFLLHIIAEVSLILAVVAGRKLVKAGCGVRGSVRLAITGNRS